MTITLGATADSLNVVLTIDGDFIQALESTVSEADDTPVDWEPGEAVTIVFDTADEWAADLTGNVASWDVDKADVAALVEAIGSRIGKVKLLYTATGDVDVVWATGTVQVVR